MNQFLPGDLAVTVKCLRPGARVFVFEQNNEWVKGAVLNYQNKIIIATFRVDYLEKLTFR